MVTPTRTPAPGRRLRPVGARAALLGVAAALAVALLAGGAAPAAAQSETLYFLTIKRGFTDASGSGEDLFDRLGAAHGKLTGGRGTQTGAVELDIYGVSRDAMGLGVGLEVLGYDHDWLFGDGTQVHLRTKGVLFTFKTFLRLGSVFPFFGFGLGNYYVNYSQTGGPSLRDSPDAVYNVRAGVRVLLGRLGLLLEAGNTRAQLPIDTDIGRAKLELGGIYSNVGLSWVF
jgi:hypothetical protein